MEVAHTGGEFVEREAPVFYRTRAIPAYGSSPTPRPPAPWAFWCQKSTLCGTAREPPSWKAPASTRRSALFIIRRATVVFMSFARRAMN